MCPQLDDAVYAASKELRGRGAPDPDVLFLLATGGHVPPGAGEINWRLPLSSVSGVPSAWRSKELFASEAHGATFWTIVDAPGEDETGNASDPSAPAWTAGFPVWLAACSGASLAVHAGAGFSLDAEGDARVGTLSLTSDHINLSGRTPLLGLGHSRLGSIFPDQTNLHHEALRLRAQELADERGIETSEAIVGCALAPSQLTPAERAWFARAGAQVGAFGLADPLIAMAHASISCLSIIAVLEGSQRMDLKSQILAADKLAPALDDLLGALAPDLARTAFELREEAV